MQPSRRKLSARIERDEDITVHEDENAHLWAVSYSDFLMALLSFFILFFSMAPDKKESLILNLAQEFNGASAGSAGTGNGTGSGTTMASKSEEGPIARIPATVLHDLKELQVTSDKEANDLIINFPDDLFAIGKFEIRKDKIGLMKTVLEKLKPYHPQIKMYFEGHTDSVPYLTQRESIPMDNYVLSSLRANSALNIARHLGFSDQNMFIQAASSHVRKSRTLSLRIQQIAQEEK